MNATEIDLRDFPADVQDMLRARAIREAKPMERIIADYVLAAARMILATANPRHASNSTS